jgi:hypothetical protein
MLPAPHHESRKLNPSGPTSEQLQARRAATEAYHVQQAASVDYARKLAAERARPVGGGSLPSGPNDWREQE